MCDEQPVSISGEIALSRKMQRIEDTRSSFLRESNNKKHKTETLRRIEGISRVHVDALLEAETAATSKLRPELERGTWKQTCFESQIK